MESRINTYQAAGLKAVEYQLQYLHADGCYIWDGYAKDAYHKQAYSWALAGHIEPAHRLLTWIRHNTLQENGQLVDYAGDCYKHSWFFQSAQRLGRFDLSYPVMAFLKSCQEPCGGLPHFAGDPLLRSLATCCTGLSALYFGDLAMAERIGACAISMLQQQPDESRFYYQMTRDGKLATPEVDPGALYIDIFKPKQDYWEVGLPLQLMCRLYQATGDAQYKDFAKQFFEFKLRCYEDNFAFVGSGKSSLGAAVYYLISGDKRARDAAIRFCEFLVETQYPEGGWRDEDEPDKLLIYIDHAAEFNVWLQEISAIIPGADAIWGGNG